MKNKLAVIALFICMMGCKVTKDNRAFTRVISTPTLAERTYRALEVTHPCVTTVTLGRDTTIVDTIRIDNTDTTTIDSLLNVLLDSQPTEDSATIIANIRKRIYAEVAKRPPTVVHITDVRHDTLVDTRATNQLTADNNRLQGQSIELNKQVVTLKKTNTHKTLYMIGLGLLILVGTVVYIKKK